MAIKGYPYYPTQSLNIQKNSSICWILKDNHNQYCLPERIIYSNYGQKIVTMQELEKQTKSKNIAKRKNAQNWINKIEQEIQNQEGQKKIKSEKIDVTKAFCEV